MLMPALYAIAGTLEPAFQIETPDGAVTITRYDLPPARALDDEDRTCRTVTKGRPVTGVETPGET